MSLSTARHSFSAKISYPEVPQTDFGSLYFLQPSVTASPTTTQELASTLQHYHHQGTPVTIRNTGHSINGQTLTSGVQIAVGGIQGCAFDREKMHVTVGTGTSWHEVLKGIDFPDFCLPMFPNNPNQEIKIGGTASVGGVGFYSSRVGGFWNHVESLILVSMKGEIIPCSRTENADYFRYALAGFGRIGVISELTIKVVASEKHVLPLLLTYRPGTKRFTDDLSHLVHDDSVAGLMLSETFHPKAFAGPGHLTVPLAALFMEVGDEEDVLEKCRYITDFYHDTFTIHINETNRYQHILDVALKPRCASKRGIVYWYPHSALEHQIGFAHPWSDYILPKGAYSSFVEAAKEVIAAYKFQHYLMREPTFHDHVQMGHLPVYAIRKLSAEAHEEYPLGLDLKNDDDYSLMVGIMSTIPASEQSKCREMTKEISEIAYSLGGKRYMYGLHTLTRKQVVHQYGIKTIERWQEIKDDLDPKHLLNIGVIEHLDD